MRSDRQGCDIDLLFSVDHGGGRGRLKTLQVGELVGGGLDLDCAGVQVHATDHGGPIDEPGTGDLTEPVAGE